MGRKNKEKVGGYLNNQLSDKISVIKHFLSAHSCFVLYLDSDLRVIQSEGDVETCIGLAASRLLGSPVSEITASSEFTAFISNASDDDTFRELIFLTQNVLSPPKYDVTFIGRDAKRIALLFAPEPASAENAKEDAIKLKALFESAIDGIVIINDRGTIESVNPATLKMFGYRQSELIGSNVSMLMPQPDSKKHDSYLGNYLKTGERKIIGIGREVIAKRKDGHEFHIKLSISEINEGKNRTFMGMIHDLTNQKLAEVKSREYTAELEKKVKDRTIELTKTNENLENEIKDRKEIEAALIEGQRLYREIARNFPDGSISVLDKDLRYVFIDGKELFDLGLSSSSLIGTKIIDRLPPNIGYRITEILKNVFNNRKETIEIEMNHQSYMLTAVPLINTLGNVHQILVVEENITNQKIAEKNIKEALKKEKELNSLKSRFVSMASHEFRTPLSTILSSATLIDKYTEKGDIEGSKKHIERIKASVSNLTQILNEFLSLSKLEEGVISFSPRKQNLPEFCREICEEMQLICKKGQTVEYNHLGDMDEFEFDSQILKNVIHNLLSNAIKYSSENSKIKLQTEIANANMCLKVSDQGIGIPKEDQNHLFERFFRAGNAVNIEGTGLGLSIVKKYVELMNGTISFESESDKGSTFSVNLKPT